MKYFLDTTETIPNGVGFSQFGMIHIVWLAIFLALMIINCVVYGYLSVKGKDIWRKVIASLVVLDEVFKMVMLTVGGRYTLSYLPLHLCSINIFVIAFHTWKPTKVTGAFLYTVCIPGALAALLFPSWTALPPLNFMHIHSFTVHILLTMYPLVLAVNGDLEIKASNIPGCLLLLFGMAVPIYIVNILLDTNYMFLMSADSGNPLYLFEQLWGNHLWGFPVIITGVLIVMYVPVLIFRALRKKEKSPA